MLRFSIFEELNGIKGAFQTQPTQTLNFSELINYYKSVENKQLSQAILDAPTPEAKKLLKDKRAYYTPYGTFSSRKNENILHSNSIISIDIDDLESTEQAEEIRNKLSTHKSILFSLLSVRGKGVKAMMLVKATYTPEQQYNQLKHIFSPYLANFLNIDANHIDNAQFKVSQPCYFSYDSEMYINADAPPLTLDFNYKEKERIPFVSVDVPTNATNRIEAYILKTLSNKIACFDNTKGRHQQLYAAKGLGQLVHYAPNLEHQILSSFIEAGHNMYGSDSGRKTVVKSVKDAYYKGINEPINNDVIESIINEISHVKQPYKLNFSNKPNADYTYCSIFNNEMKIIYYTDNSKGTSFKGNHFLIFENSFNVLNGNPNFNAPSFNENERMVQMREEEFIDKLMRAYLVLKYLNPNKEVKELINIFKYALHRLVWESNHTFNVEYVLEVFVPEWNSMHLITEIKALVQVRNWKVHKFEHCKKISEFQSRLLKDERLYRVNHYLKLLPELIKRGEFIEHIEVGLERKEEEPYVWEFINDFNKKMFGCRAYCDFLNFEKLKSYLLSLCTQNTHTILTTNIVCVKTVHKTQKAKFDVVFDTGETIQLPTYRSLEENAGCSRRVIKKFIEQNHTPSQLNNFIEEVKYRLENPKSLTFIRTKAGRLQASPMKRVHTIDIAENNIRDEAYAELYAELATDDIQENLKLRNDVIYLSYKSQRKKEMDKLINEIEEHQHYISTFDNRTAKYKTG